MPYLMALKALPWKLVGWCALGLFVAALFVALKMEQAQNAKLKTQLNSCTVQREADQRAYASAQAEAQAKNQAQIATVKAEQQRITNDVETSLNDRLARLRSELRAQGASAAQGAAGSSGTPALPKPAPSAVGKAGLCLAADQLLRAAENEERHDQLITWVERQLKVDPNQR